MDESKARAFILVATYVAAQDLKVVRKALTALLLPGERRLHFTHESAPRRKMLMSRIAELPVTARIYVAHSASDVVDRRVTLTEATVEAIARHASRLTIERDSTAVTSDRRIIADLVRSAEAPMSYVHLEAKDDPCLWISDAVAWCHQRGGPWHERYLPLVVSQPAVK